MHDVYRVIRDVFMFRVHHRRGGGEVNKGGHAAQQHPGQTPESQGRIPLWQYDVHQNAMFDGLTTASTMPADNDDATDIPAPHTSTYSVVVENALFLAQQDAVVRSTSPVRRTSNHKEKPNNDPPPFLSVAEPELSIMY